MCVCVCVCVCVCEGGGGGVEVRERAGRDNETTQFDTISFLPQRKCCHGMQSKGVVIFGDHVPCWYRDMELGSV